MQQRPAPTVRVAAVVGVLALAPITAELIQAYLGGTGDLAWTAFAIVFLAPMYGGAAVLIREVAVASGRGWPGRLLMAAAFGVLMTTVVDGSLFMPHRPEIPYWDMLVGAATVGNVSVYAAQSWIVGHIVMSVSAPLAVVECLIPASRGRRWLGVGSMAVLAVAGVAIAWLVHHDPDASPVSASTLDYVVAVLVASGLVAAAMTPLGRPLSTVAGRRAGSPWSIGVIVGVIMLARGLWPSWPGLVLDLSVLLVGSIVLARRCRSPLWTWQHTGAVVTGVLVATALSSFTNPVPDGADSAGKYAQNTIVLVLVVALGVLLSRRTRNARPTVDS